MVFLICCVALALLAGLRALLGPLPVPRLGGWAAVALGLAAGTQLVGLFWGFVSVSPLLGVVCCGWWMLLNSRLSGARWMFVGLLANGIAMITHGGAMPLAPEIVAQLGLGLPGNLVAGTKNVITAPTLWRWLGDGIPIQTPWALFVASPGDMVILAAVGRYLCTRPAQLEPSSRRPLPPLPYGVRQAPVRGMEIDDGCRCDCHP